jgi:putative endonuclease
MFLSSQQLGKLGEDIACTYLKRKGYILLDRNFQNTHGYKYGEIDIVARDQKTVVFAEVKTRLSQGSETIFPEENISPGKLRHLEHIADTYLRVKKLDACSYRFDAIAIVYDVGKRHARVRHFEYIFF